MLRRQTGLTPGPLSTHIWRGVEIPAKAGMTGCAKVSLRGNDKMAGEARTPTRAPLQGGRLLTWIAACVAVGMLEEPVAPGGGDE